MVSVMACFDRNIVSLSYITVKVSLSREGSMLKGRLMPDRGRIGQMSILTGATAVVLYLSLVPFIFLIIKVFKNYS